MKLRGSDNHSTTVPQMEEVLIKERKSTYQISKH